MVKSKERDGGTTALKIQSCLAKSPGFLWRHDTVPARPRLLAISRHFGDQDAVGLYVVGYNTFRVYMLLHLRDVRRAATPEADYFNTISTHLKTTLENHLEHLGQFRTTLRPPSISSLNSSCKVDPPGTSWFINPLEYLTLVGVLNQLNAICFGGHSL